MRPRSLLLAASVVAACVAASPRAARADQEFAVSVSGNSVTVTANAPWHIDRQYSWKVKKDGKTVARVHFKLDDAAATATNLPPGKVTLKGAVCNTEGDHKACKPFAKDITIGER